MKTFYEYNHSNGIDSYKNYIGDNSIDKMLVFLGRNRDSGLLDNSNFESALKFIGNESNNVQVHRFGHWACGWFELILINPEDTETIKLCEKILNDLSNYPVFDDEDYYSREYNATIENIKESAHFNGYDLNDSQLHNIYSWLWENNQHAIESSDDTGGYPDDSEIIDALKALNLYQNSEN